MLIAVIAELGLCLSSSWRLVPTGAITLAGDGTLAAEVLVHRSARSGAYHDVTGCRSRSAELARSNA